MSKELEEAKEYLEHEVRVYEDNKEINQLIGGKSGEKQHKINKILLNYIENSIPKKKVEEILTESNIKENNGTYRYDELYSYLYYETKINLKNKNKEELMDLLNETLEITKKQQAELAEKDREIKKKDKIVNEMSSAMTKIHCCIANVVEEEICDEKCVGNNDWHCETCIKQYFERKAEK